MIGWLPSNPGVCHLILSQRSLAFNNQITSTTKWTWRNKSSSNNQRLFSIRLPISKRLRICISTTTRSTNSKGKSSESSLISRIPTTETSLSSINPHSTLLRVVNKTIQASSPLTDRLMKLLMLRKLENACFIFLTDRCLILIIPTTLDWMFKEKLINKEETFFVITTLLLTLSSLHAERYILLLR